MGFYLDVVSITSESTRGKSRDCTAHHVAIGEGRIPVVRLRGSFKFRPEAPIQRVDRNIEGSPR